MAILFNVVNGYLNGRELFTLGAELVRGPGSARGGRSGGITEVQVDALEAEIDGWQTTLPALTHFILPGGSPAAAGLHVARTVCRRAERRVLAGPRLGRPQTRLHRGG